MARFPDLPRVAPSSTPADRIRAMLELVDLEEARLRQRLRAEGVPPDDVERRVDAWYLERPGARDGDAEGRPGRWPRS